MKKWDVVIIGSGISSLTSAAILAKKGKSVCVLEKYNKPGGYLHCFNRFGHRFDTGAHYVGAMEQGQPFHTLLKYLDVYDQDYFVPLDPDGFDVMNFPDFKVEFPRGYSEIIKRLTDLFPTESQGIKSYFSKIMEVAGNFPTYEFSEEADMTFITKVLETPLKKVVEDLTHNKSLQAVFYSYCALHGVYPADVSFGMHAIVTDSLIRGPAGLSKGGDALAQKYVEKIKSFGGEVHLRKNISKIETNGKVAKAVITSEGERFEAQWIISGIHPKATFGLISDEKVFTPAFHERMKNIKESAGIFGIYTVCNSELKMNPLKNYYYFASSDPSQMFESDGPRAKPNSVFLSPANRVDGAVSGKVSMNIHAKGDMAWFEPWRDSRYGKRPDEYQNLKKEYAHHVFDLVNDYTPGFNDSVEQFVTSSPVTNLHFNGSLDGSSYGIYHSIENTGVRSLGPRTHVSNLLLTGQSCLFPGLLGAAISALRTSGHIVGIKPLLKELKESVSS